jgi:PKD repeat protein
MKRSQGIFLVAVAILLCVQVVAAENPPVYVQSIGSYGTGNGQVRMPFGIDYRATDGKLYVADTSNSRIETFTTSGAFAGLISVTPKNARGIATTSSYAFIADTGNHRIIRRALFITTVQQATLTWGSYGTGTANFNQPTSVAVDPAGQYVYVVDYGNNRVMKYTIAGVFVKQIGTSGTSGAIPGLGKLYRPFGIAVDPTNTYVYVSDENHYVHRFTTGGVTAGYLGGSGSTDGKFNTPKGITCDASGNIYVADTGNHRAQKFTSGGGFLTKWGSWGNLAGQFKNPVDVTLDGSGNIYVTDSSNDRVQKFSPSSTSTTLTAGFTVAPASGGPRPLSVQFTDTSTGAASWEYSFGDGTSSTQRSPSHQYLYGGNYYVRQTVRNGQNSQWDDAYVPVYSAVPGKIEAENFDGTTDGYTDTTTGNSGGKYRQTDVDIEAGGSGYQVGWIAEGETLSYTIRPGADGTYPLTIHAGAWQTGRTIEILLNGQTVKTVNTPKTASSSVLGDVSTTLFMTIGVQRLTFRFHGGSQNFDYFTFGTSSETGTADFVGTPRSGTAPLTVTFTSTCTGNPSKLTWSFGDNSAPEIDANVVTHTYTQPGTYTVTLSANSPYLWADTETKAGYIVVNPPGGTSHTAVTKQAEDYDTGGEGVGYHDTTAANEGGKYRTDGVDIESCPEGGYTVAYIREGEWLRYTMTNAVAGTYPLTIRAGNWEAGTTKTVEVKVNDVVKAVITVPMVASSSGYAEATANVPIPAGSHQIKLVFHGGKFNLNWFRI